MNDKSATPNSRRGFIKILGGIGLGWLAASVYPIYRFLGPQEAPNPFGEDGRALVDRVTPAEVARPGMGKNGGYGGRGLVVFRNNEGNLRAFDSKCTHAGCNVAFEGDKIFCNCHGGTYDLEGKNVDGPPPKPLTELGVEEEDGALYVFRLDAGGNKEG